MSGLWRSRLAAAVLLAFGSAGPVGAAAFPVATGHVFRDAAWAPPMVVLPAGTFTMGSDPAETEANGVNPKLAVMERPRHAVRLPVRIAMGRYPVTIADYDRFARATGRSVEGGCMVLRGGVWSRDERASYRNTDFWTTPRNPVTCVDAADADAYAAWLSRETGQHYRLPTEAELEYATRAGTRTVRWWGDGADHLCRYLNGADATFDTAYPGNRDAYRSCNDGYLQTSPVGAFAANPWGLYDMLGNVEQWSGDCFRESYAGATENGSTPVLDGDCKQRAVRGGTFHSGATLFRAAARGKLPAEMKASSVGFRLVREAAGR